MVELDRRQFLAATAAAGVFPGETLARPALSKRAIRALRSAVRGRVLVPRDSTRVIYNRRFEGRRPDAVVQVESTADVAAAIRWAERFDVRSRGALRRSQLCRLLHDRRRGRDRPVAAQRGVRVSGGRATVGPGAQLIDVQHALTRRGLGVPAGSCPSVGIGGLALGGGHGLAGRRFGLTSDNLLAARDGHRRRARPARGRGHERGPLLGLPGRGRRQLRDRHGADAEDPPRARRRLVLRLVAVVAGGRGAGRLAALRA